jgi:hypothetical protein
MEGKMKKAIIWFGWTLICVAFGYWWAMNAYGIIGG